MGKGFLVFPPPFSLKPDDFRKFWKYVRQFQDRISRIHWSSNSKTPPPRLVLFDAKFPHLLSYLALFRGFLIVRNRWSEKRGFFSFSFISSPPSDIPSSIFPCLSSVALFFCLLGGISEGACGFLRQLFSIRHLSRFSGALISFFWWWVFLLRWEIIFAYFVLLLRNHRVAPELLPPNLRPLNCRLLWDANEKSPYRGRGFGSS